MSTNAHVADVPTWCLPAPADVAESAVAAGYSADRAAVLQMLNDVLATELVCVLHYRRYHFMARGLDSQRIARELLAHSYKELGHAARVAERIVQLGGEPDLAPDWLASPGHARYIEGDSLEAMMQEIQLAERDAIDRYRVFIRYLREHDPTTRHMLEGILAVEEKHAHELADLLVAFPDNSSGMSPAAT